MAITVSADVVSNGATLTFGSTELGPIADINPDETAAQIDVAGLADDVDLFEVGSVAKAVEVTVIGNQSTLAIGDKGALTLTLKSGAMKTLSQAVLAAKPLTLTRNGRVETKLTFLPTRAAAAGT